MTYVLVGPLYTRIKTTHRRTVMDGAEPDADLVEYDPNRTQW